MPHLPAVTPPTGPTVVTMRSRGSHILQDHWTTEGNWLPCLLQGLAAAERMKKDDGSACRQPVGSRRGRAHTHGAFARVARTHRSYPASSQYVGSRVGGVGLW